MASIINAGTSTGTALNITTDTSGSLKIQTSGVDAISISSAQAVTLANPLPAGSGGTGITSLGTGVATFLGTPSSANLLAVVTDETGTGALVFADSPTLAGTPLAPTASPGTNTTQIATTAFVTAAIPTTGTMAAQNANAVAITGGTVTGITDLTVADGGTGVSTIAANAVVLGNGTSAIQTVAPSTAGNVLTSDGTTWTSAVPAAYPLTSGTAVASTSGTNIDFTGIPSWVKRITVMFNGVSTNGSSIPLIQLGDSGGIENTGYTANGLTVDVLNTQQTTGLPVSGTWANTDVLNGIVTLVLLDNLTWIFNFVGSTSTIVRMGVGSKSVSATLDRIRITTVNGTDTFDAGSINILYE